MVDTVTASSGADAGDRSDGWKAAYRRVAKEPLRSNLATNTRRLKILGVGSLHSAGTWIDIGAGDGNLATALAEWGVHRTVALEPQLDLLAATGGDRWLVAGVAESLPIRNASADVLVVMDVLHHVPVDLQSVVAQELRRVLRRGGHLLVCEPAATRCRAVLTAVLLSALGRLTQFTRDKRLMVIAEQETLGPWLSMQGSFAESLEQRGFEVQMSRTGLLHCYHRFRAR